MQIPEGAIVKQPLVFTCSMALWNTTNRSKLAWRPIQNSMQAVQLLDQSEDQSSVEVSQPTEYQFDSEDFRIQAGGPVRPCARCAIMPPRLLKPSENVHLQAEFSCSACI